MKRLLRIIGILLGVVVVVLICLTIFLKGYLSGERLKSIIIPKLEALTGRPVTIRSIDFSLFRGVVIKGLRIQERGEAEDFARMQEFVLDYSLLPLLKRQLVIKKIEVVSPYLFIKKRKDGTYNFSDMTKKRAEEAKQKKVERGIPVALVADRVSVRNALVQFTDSSGKLPDISADISDVELKASFRETLSLAGRIDLKKADIAMGGIQTSTSGKMGISGDALTLDLTTALGKDSIKTSGTIRDYLTGPDVRLNFTSRRLDLDALMQSSGAGRASARNTGPEGMLYRELQKGYGPVAYAASRQAAGLSGTPPVAAAGKGEIRASGNVKVDEIRYKGYRIKDFSTGYKYLNGIVTLSPLVMGLAGGEDVNATGTAKGDFLFRYTPGSASAMGAMERTLAGKGVVDLNKLEVRGSNITRAIALFTGIDELGSPSFDRALFNFTVKNRTILLDGTMNSAHIRLNPSGTVGFDKRINVLTDLMLSPLLTEKLSRSARITGYLRGKEGWSTIPLKISGTTERPSVGLSPVGVRKQMQKGIQEELERRLFKELFAPRKEEGRERPEGKRPEDLLKGIFGK